MGRKLRSGMETYSPSCILPGKLPILFYCAMALKFMRDSTCGLVWIGVVEVTRRSTVDRLSSREQKPFNKKRGENDPQLHIGIFSAIKCSRLNFCSSESVSLG